MEKVKWRSAWNIILNWKHKNTNVFHIMYENTPLYLYMKEGVLVYTLRGTQLEVRFYDGIDGWVLWSVFVWFSWLANLIMFTSVSKAFVVWNGKLLDSVTSQTLFYSWDVNSGRHPRKRNIGHTIMLLKYLLLIIKF